MRIHPWKTPLVILCLLISLIGCQKSKSSENSAPPTPTPAVTSAYEVLFATHNTAYCGSSFISDLRINDGTSIGNVVVNNDAAYLYLTYNLATNWYMTSAQSFVGKKSQIPSTSNGNLDHNRFPGKKTLNVCDLTQKLSFKIPLAEVQTDNNGQCNTGSQFFIAMRSSVKKINPSGNCNAGQDQDAWAVPVLINPGNNGTWATAFYYCKQICNTSSSWCAFGQGYWFSKPDVVWCSQNVQFGGLVVTRGAGRALWPALTNLVKK